MDDVVKILLGVLFVGFSIYNSARKKKAKLEKSAEIKKNKLAEEQNVKPATEQPEQQYYNQKQEEDLSFINVIKNEVINYNNENKVQFTNNVEQNKENEIVEENSVVEFDDKINHSALKIDDGDFIDFDEINEEKEEEYIDFDLEKAVIYSEILKPKYF